MKNLHAISLFLALLVLASCTPAYTPEPNSVAFATNIWYASGVINGEEWIAVYQLGTADTDRDHYIKYHVDEEKSNAIEGLHFNFLTPDSCLIPRNKYIGYIKLEILNFTATNDAPRLTLVLDGDTGNMPEQGFDVCYVDIYPYSPGK